jgi:peptidoglycan/xylan/chitin deacetylase (PgdA/CDA1 family)
MDGEGRPDVALSFDNGPSEVTPVVLDALDRVGLRATFFVVGSRIDTAGMDYIRRAHAAGHRIGNHTWSHSGPLGALTAPGAARAEIERTQDLLGELATPARLFRPVGGGAGGVLDRRLLSSEALETIVEGKYSLVLWNSVPRDWEQPDHWVDRALRQTARGSARLVVLHDHPGTAMGHLSEFIDRARARGTRFVQDLPESCVPVLEGVERAPLDAYVTTRKTG